MATFSDRVLLELSDPATIRSLLLAGRRMRTMLAATYDLSTARIDQVSEVEVRSITLQHPLFPVSRRTGQWSQTEPSYVRADLIQDVPATATPVWADLLVEVVATVVTELDPAGAQSVLSRAFDDFTTLDEFRERFTFFDLDAFLTKHRITTVEELRDAFDYTVTDVQLRTPGPFDPDDPANTYTLPITMAAVTVDPFDLTTGLRAARLLQSAAKGLTGAASKTLPVEPVAAHAIAVVFPAAGLPPDGPTTTEVEELYAGEGVLSLFLS